CSCAAQATCSCGKKAAQHCDCERASTENVKPADNESCNCGQRKKGECTCGGSAECEPREGEVSF
ncbi:hypothetical protein BABINDRAFT_22187, partial [Babjeviella inositovora NRRL Y-12698]